VIVVSHRRYSACSYMTYSGKPLLYSNNIWIEAL